MTVTHGFHDAFVRSNRLRFGYPAMLAAGAAVLATAASPLDEAASTLEKWVEARQLLSKTRSDWQTDREVLEQSVKLFERELNSVEEQISKISTNNTQVEKERIEAETVQHASRETLDQAKQFAEEFESKIRKLVPRLPAPLQESLRKELNRMPADPAGTRMTAAERIQIAVGILNELDKFNNAVAIFSEKRNNARGEEVAVETVYVGLGAAYFVSGSNDFAGTGTPGENGWEWTVKSELASPIREVIRIYRNERGARFVALPAVIR